MPRSNLFCIYIYISCDSWWSWRINMKSSHPLSPHIICKAGVPDKWQYSSVIIVNALIITASPVCLWVRNNIHVNITVTSWWAWWRLKSPASPLFVQSLVQAQIKENIKAQRHWPSLDFNHHHHHHPMSVGYKMAPLGSHGSHGVLLE